MDAEWEANQWGQATCLLGMGGIGKHVNPLWWSLAQCKPKQARYTHNIWRIRNGTQTKGSRVVHRLIHAHCRSATTERCYGMPLVNSFSLADQFGTGHVIFEIDYRLSTVKHWFRPWLFRLLSLTAGSCFVKRNSLTCKLEVLCSV